MKKQSLLIVCVLLLAATTVLAQGRRTLNLSEWEFSRDTLNYQQVTIPHDWAISGPFDKKWDLQHVAITQNGETEATEKSGRSGALPWIGSGYYRTHVELDELPDFAELQFDGAMSDAHVFVNGREVGRWPYGYNAFKVNITNAVKVGKNDIFVTLNNMEESSRWYPGGGIYRPVTLITTPKAHIDPWQTQIITNPTEKKGPKDIWRVNVGTQIQGIGEGDENQFTMTMQLIDPTGKPLATPTEIPVRKQGKVIQRFGTANPQLWSPESPTLYQIKMQLYKGSQLVDEYTQKFGIREVKVSKEHGFQLNGVSRKLQGVCLHHDLGPLGAAVNKAALIRQVKILKDMGCDAIRTSHNMPSQMQMEVYDSLGMMVMAESFDMWIYPKCKNGYARYFNDWADRDITNLVLNHRNHPSLVMWSIGNEIPEQWSVEGLAIAEHLQNLCHKLDPTRPVTQGMDRAEDALYSGMAQAMDVPGFNYRVHKYHNNIEKLPQGFLLGSETASTVSSRGVYKFPVEVTNHGVYSDGQCSSYDVEYCSWSNLPDDDFLMQDDNEWTIGQFVWTGFDYLGEPTPYDEYWPSRSSYFGICDLAGLPKDRYYLYRSQWNKTDHTIHLLPHWTWPGREGQVTPVYCYTDFPTAELFVNGKSQGRISKKTDAHEIICDHNRKELNTAALDRYRLRWNNVVYEPGELRVVVYDAEGRACGEQTIKTAGKGNALKLQSDRKQLTADGQDLAYVTVSIVDKNGTELPTADDCLEFEVEGAGSFRAVCNGDATSLESFTQPSMHLFSGKLVVTVQSAVRKGTLVLKVKDKNNHRLKAQLRIPVK